eukprot:1250905-Pyramimonas_sp.AAC.1
MLLRGRETRPRGWRAATSARACDALNRGPFADHVQEGAPLPAVVLDADASNSSFMIETEHLGHGDLQGLS